MEKPIKNLTLKFNNINELKILSNLSKDDGETDIKILLDINENLLTFLLKDKRKVNNKLINSLNLEENIIID